MDVLERALKKKREEREKSRRKRMTEVHKALDKLSREISFGEAIVFGSLTEKGQFTDESDIDIAFAGLADEDFFRAQAFLSRELGCEVDVVQLEKSGRLKKKIREEGVPWIKRGSIS